MKTGIHPDYHPIFIQMSDGTKYENRSTWGKAGDTLVLDVDPKTHPAWVGGVNLRKTGQMEKFQNKFGSFGANKGAAAKANVKTEEKKINKKSDKKDDKK